MDSYVCQKYSRLMIVIIALLCRELALTPTFHPKRCQKVSSWSLKQTWELTRNSWNTAKSHFKEPCFYPGVMIDCPEAKYHSCMSLLWFAQATNKSFSVRL